MPRGPISEDVASHSNNGDRRSAGACLAESGIAPLGRIETAEREMTVHEAQELLREGDRGWGVAARLVHSSPQRARTAPTPSTFRSGFFAWTTDLTSINSRFKRIRTQRSGV